ncbi:Spermatogenesis-associated protein 22 [Bagarius yarrelli]|uniref:Spermatogenesis-associated protein 22 n=1 Tax=Bagarius yarrelli TaxID=175774 RepID=A0A556UXZ6_BAGYA|nr:Spermatogenesis-associated protein 22 [Bagarius yarrelli]
MLSFTSAIHSSETGSTQLPANREPLANWNQQVAPQPQQSKVWPTVSTGRGCTPLPYPQKRTYAWSPTGPPRPQGRQDFMAAAQILKRGGFPSGGPTTQVQNYTLNTKQLMQQQQQSFSRQQSKIYPPEGSFTPSDPTAHCQRPPAQSQSFQWNIKAGGVSKGTWVEDTFGSLGRESSGSQQKKAPPKKSLRILTAVIEGMKYWSQFKDKLPIMFEVFATLDSAVTLGRFGAKNFLISNGKDSVPCVYYENDQVLPRLIRGQMHRCVGNYDRQKNIFTCVSVRAASLSEQRNAQEVVKASDAEMRNEIQTLSEM